MSRLFPGMKTWEFGALMSGGHSVGGVHKDISGFTTSQWVSCGNGKITTRFVARFAGQGYNSVQCTDCNEMGFGEFHTVGKRPCTGGAIAYDKWQQVYLKGGYVEGNLPQICDTEDLKKDAVLPDIRDANVTGLDAG